MCKPEFPDGTDLVLEKEKELVDNGKDYIYQPIVVTTGPKYVQGEIYYRLIPKREKSNLPENPT